MSKGKNFGIRIPGPAEAHPAIRKALQQVVNYLGIESTPTLGGLTVNGDIDITGSAALGTLTVSGTTLMSDLTLSGDLILSSVTASRLAFFDGDKIAGSVTDLTTWVSGTNNRITVTDDLDGTLTLSTPQDIHTGASPTFADLTISTPSNIYALSHDSFANFDANEHFLQTAITNVSTALSTGILTVTTGTGVLGSTTNNSANWDTAYSHSQLTSGNPHQVTPTELSLVIGTNTQAYDAGLTNLAGVAMAADKFYYTSADNTHVAGTVTSAARSILDDTTVGAIRTTLGVGTTDSPVFVNETLTGYLSAQAGANISGGGWGVMPYVANSLVIDNSSSNVRFFATGPDTSTDGGYLFYTGQTDGGANLRMTITPGGNVGIGTTTPQCRLHVADYAAGTWLGGTGRVVQIAGDKPSTGAGTSGQLSIVDTSALAADNGGSIAFAAEYVSGNDLPFAVLGGFKEDATSGNQQGYFALWTRSASAMVKHLHIDSSGNTFIGDGGTTDYTEIEADGTLVMHGAATTWEDYSSALINNQLVNPSAHIVVNTTEGSITYKTTCDTGDYSLTSAQMQHSWKLGSVIYPHIHWWQTTAAQPNWVVQYRWQKNGAAKTTAWTSLALDTNASAWSSGTLNQITASATGITPPAGYQLSDIVQFRIIRDVANTLGVYGGAESSSVDADVMAFDFHYEKDTLGSNDEYTK